MLSDEDIQPSDESKHIAIVVDLRQTIFGVAFLLVPDVPFVECDFDRLGRQAKVDAVYLCEIN
jgi:hypothetical protein